MYKTGFLLFNLKIFQSQLLPSLLSISLRLHCYANITRSRTANSLAVWVQFVADSGFSKFVGRKYVKGLLQGHDRRLEEIKIIWDRMSKVLFVHLWLSKLDLRQLCYLLQDLRILEVAHNCPIWAANMTIQEGKSRRFPKRHSLSPPAV
jgi:hypothetical protein